MPIQANTPEFRRPRAPWITLIGLLVLLASLMSYGIYVLQQTSIRVEQERLTHRTQILE